MLALANTIK